MRSKSWIANIILAMCLTGVGSTYCLGQICGPATIHYVVRDSKGRVVDASTLKPANFIAEKGEYWKREVDKITFSATGNPKDNAEVQTIEYVGGNACKMKLDEITLSMDGKTMHLIFGLSLDSYNDRDRSHRVVDSLPFSEGTFRLEATADNLIPANEWKPVTKKP